ncbi:Hypothetical predicted protein, partial [Pelobates cultripes]
RQNDISLLFGIYRHLSGIYRNTADLHLERRRRIWWNARGLKTIHFISEDRTVYLFFQLLTPSSGSIF